MKAKKTEESVIERTENIATAKSHDQFIQSLMCEKQTHEV